MAALANHNKAFPTFAGIPAYPKDQRPLKAWGPAARQIERAGDQLVAATAPGTWTLTGTEAFAAETLRHAGPAFAAGESTTAETEAFARDQRKRATPPPPPKR
ncbi:MAG TPA: hypothetical protein VFW47_18570 [Phenylobacterium sp.]|nr:hypothetical protein [Phenylobacterium sp.]